MNYKYFLPVILISSCTSLNSEQIKSGEEWLTYVVPIIAAIAGWNSAGKLRNKNTDTLTWKGYLNFLLIILTLSTAIAQSKFKSASDAIYTTEIAKKQKTIDSLLKRKIDSSTITIITKIDTSTGKIETSISETVGKIKVNLDSSNNLLAKSFIDSTNNLSLPTFDIGDCGNTKGLSFGKKNNGTLYYTENFSSRDAGSTHFILESSAILKDSIKGYVFLGSGFPLTYSDRVPTEDCRSAEVMLPNGSVPDSVYIWLRGSYESLNYRRKISINSMYFLGKGNDWGRFVNYSIEQKNLLKLFKSLEGKSGKRKLQ